MSQAYPYQTPNPSNGSFLEYISPFNPYHSTFVHQQQQSQRDQYERRPTYDEYIRKGSTATIEPQPQRPALEPRKASSSGITRPQHTSIIRISSILDPQDLLSLTADQVRRKTIHARNARNSRSRNSMHRKSIRRNGLPSRPDTYIRAKNTRLPALVRTPGGSVLPAHTYVARQGRPLAIRERQVAIRRAMEEAARVADAERRPSQTQTQSERSNSVSVSALQRKLSRSASTSTASVVRKLSISRLKAKYIDRADRAATKAAIRDAKAYAARQAHEDVLNKSEYPLPQVQRAIKEEEMVREWERGVRRERDEREERSRQMTMENIHSYPVALPQHTQQAAKFQEYEYEPRHEHTGQQHGRRGSDEDEWQDVPSTAEQETAWENEVRREREEREARSRQMSFENMHSNTHSRSRSRSRGRKLSTNTRAKDGRGMLADINEVNTPGLAAWNKMQDASLGGRKESIAEEVESEKDSDPEPEAESRGRSLSKASVPNWRDDPRSRSRSNSYAPRAKLRPRSTSRARTRQGSASASNNAGSRTRQDSSRSSAKERDDREGMSASITHASDIPFLPVALDLADDEERGRPRRKESASDSASSCAVHTQSQSQPPLPSHIHEHGCPMHTHTHTQMPSQRSQSHSHGSTTRDFPGSLRGRAQQPPQEETYVRYRQASADPVLQRSSFRAAPLPTIPLPAPVPAPSSTSTALPPTSALSEHAQARRPSAVLPPWEQASVPKGPTVRPVLHKANTSSTLPDEAFSPRAFPLGMDWAYDATHPHPGREMSVSQAQGKGRSASEPHIRPSLAQNSRKGSLAGILDRFGYNSRNGSVSKTSAPQRAQGSISGASGSGRSDSVAAESRAESRADSIFSLALYDRRPSETSVMSGYRESNSFQARPQHSRKPSAASEIVNVYAQLDAEVAAWEGSHPSKSKSSTMSNRGHARSDSSSSEGGKKGGFGFEFGEFHVARIEEGRKAQERKERVGGPFGVVGLGMKKESVSSWL